MAHLFEPLELRSVTLRNRIALSPMCQYTAREGVANDWHLVHLGARAMGGAGLVIVEATGIEPRGRITPECLGLWNEEQVAALRPITAFIEARGAVPAIQLAHAGVKASRYGPRHATSNAYVEPAEGGWMPVGPTARRFNRDGPVPHALATEEIRAITDAFAAAADRAVRAGFRSVELHFAHGYLGHSFLSPLMNARDDAWGGPFDHRTAFPLDAVRAVRAVIPEEMPLLVRISATDWDASGWTIEDSVRFARRLKAAGVDLIDCSSGGASRGASIPVGPGYQVPLAEQVRREAEIATGAVGMITEPAQADAIIREGRADIVLLGRQMLREANWPIRAWRELDRPGPAPIAPEHAWALAEARRR